MKTRKILTFMLAASLLTGMGSCKKDDDTTPDNNDSDLISSENNAQAEKIFAEAYNMVDYTAKTNQALYKNNEEQEALLGACATVSHDTTGSPNTITIDFGTGCTGADGRLRSGKIIATYTGRYRDAGTVITIGFDNYHVNGYKVEGTKTVENMGNNTNGNLVFKITVSNAKISGNGQSHTWSSSRENEWISGANTLTWTDDAYKISGSASGTNANNVSYTVTITKALKVEASCKWINEGTLEIKPAGALTRTVDYGNGACDDKASVTIAGRTFTFTMR